MSTDEAWDSLSSAVENITNLDHEVVRSSLREHICDHNPSRLFSYVAGDSYVRPPPIGLVGKGVSNDVWLFACPEHAQKFVAALEHFYSDKGIRARIRMF